MLSEESRGSDKTSLAGNAPEHARCAFYLSSRDSAAAAANPAKDSLGRSPHHRCLLAAGRAHGPDGNRIRPDECTLQRQIFCQAHRRDRLARLHAAVHRTHAKRRKAATEPPAR